MARNVERWVFGIGTLLLATLGVGCPNNDVLTTEPGRGVLTVQVRLPTGSGRYERGSFRIRAVRIRPQDPQADQALGVPIELLGSSQLNLALTDPTLIVTGGTLLNEGDYRVVTVIVDSLDRALIDDNPATPPTSCIEAVLQRPGVNGVLPPPESRTSEVIQAVEITDFVPIPTFHVDRNGEGTLSLVIDGSALVALMENGVQQCRPAFCQFDSSRLCAFDAQCPLDSCNRPLGTCVDDPGISCADDTGCPPGDQCSRADGFCVANPNGLCLTDLDCPHPCATVASCPPNSQTPTPCVGFYQPPTADQLRQIITFE